VREMLPLAPAQKKRLRCCVARNIAGSGLRDLTGVQMPGEQHAGVL
jgi:hypothetical protein